MLHWVVRAARAAGAERVVAILGHQHDAVKAVARRRASARARSTSRSSPSSAAPATPCSARCPRVENESDDRIVVILTGDAPLLASERIAELVARAPTSPAGMALLSTVPRSRRCRTAASCATRAASSSASSSTPTRRPSSSKIKDTNAGFYAIRLGHLRKDLATLRADNAKGELYLTDLVAQPHARGGATVDRRAVHRGLRHQRSRRSRRRRGRGAPPHQRALDARRRDDGRSARPRTSMPTSARSARTCGSAPGVALRGKTQLGDRRAHRRRLRAHRRRGRRRHEHQAVLGARPRSRSASARRSARSRHCRPASRLDEDAHIGNFVETKKTHLMAGAKANHLAYLGDASIGAKANIGAGTITCNYDGVSKHKTTIEAGAFIGSDSQLVAPVTVGRGAYVGVGHDGDQGRAARRARAHARQAGQRRGLGGSVPRGAGEAQEGGRERRRQVGTAFNCVNQGAQGRGIGAWSWRSSSARATASIRRAKMRRRRPRSAMHRSTRRARGPSSRRSRRSIRCA